MKTRSGRMKNLTAKRSEVEKRPEPNQWRHDANLPQLAKKDDTKFIQGIYDSILWRIDAKYALSETVVVGLTGCSRKSGTSSIAANLAVRASSQDRGRVLLVDANWEKPNLPRSFRRTPGPGLYDILSGEMSPRECELEEVAKNLDVLPAGKYDGNGAVHVRHQLIEEMLSEFKEDYGVILVDLPVAEELRSALPVARQLDGVLLVTRFQSVKQQQVKRVYERLLQDGIEVWGTVMNRRREYIPKWLRAWL